MARTTRPPLCAVPGCVLTRQHLDSCDRDLAPPCPGCLPALAAPGLQVCDRCAGTTAHARDACRGCLVHDPLIAADVHGDLALQLRRSGTGEHTSGTPDRSPSVNAAVVEARGQIETTLRRLAALIAAERGFTAPRRQVRGRWYVDTSMPALGEFVSRSGLWLAAHPKAADHVQALREISHGRVWSLAYPVGSTRLHIGHCPLVVTWVTEQGGRQQLVDAVCGERLDWDSSRSALVHCPGCGTDETVEWWQRQIVGDLGGEVTAAVAATWLSMHWYRPVQPSVISNWASRGKVPRLMTTPAYPGELPRPRRDARGRALFDLADIRACAEKTWGAQPQTARRGAA